MSSITYKADLSLKRAIGKDPLRELYSWSPSWDTDEFSDIQIKVATGRENQKIPFSDIKEAHGIVIRSDQNVTVLQGPLNIPIYVSGTEEGPFTITSSENNLSLTIGSNAEFTSTISNGSKTLAQAVDEINTDIDANPTYKPLVRASAISGTGIRLTSLTDESIVIGNGNANSLLGFGNGTYSRGEIIPPTTLKKDGFCVIFGTDIDNLYVTNNSGNEATLGIIILGEEAV